MNQPLRTRTCRAEPASSHWKQLRAGITLITFISATGLAQNGDFRPEKATTVTPVNQLPDANSQWEINNRRIQVQKFEKANLERKRQMEEDASRLFRLAKAGVSPATPNRLPR